VTRKKSESTKKLVYSALFVALGVLLPLAVSHSLGLQGTVLLPMHIPVLLAGFICGARYGVLVGVAVPFLSCLLTGMPPVYPMLPIMTAELAVYGLASGFFAENRTFSKTPTTLKLVISMLCGRVAYGAMFGIMFGIVGLFSHSELRALPVWGAVVTGLPGIALQLVLIPLILRAFNKKEVQNVDILQKAKDIISEGEYTLIIMKNGAIEKKLTGAGISPIIAVYESEPDVLVGAEIADKIVGKAAAMLFHLANVKSVHGELMSRAGREYLEIAGISCTYGRCIEVISARTGNGMCPLEKSVLDVSDPHEALNVLKSTLTELRKAVNA
jgi:uncharacterized membrane protein